MDDPYAQLRAAFAPSDAVQFGYPSLHDALASTDASARTAMYGDPGTLARDKADFSARVHGGLQDYLGGVQAMQPKTWGDAAYFVPGVGNALSAKDAYNAANQGDWIGAGVGALGAVPLFGAMAGPLREEASATKGIRAYHGSPHDFDSFDMSKIGTGEGAQAFGHGLYFAESEPVARSYRDNVSAWNNPMNRGQTLDADALTKELKDLGADKMPGTLANGIKEAFNQTVYQKGGSAVPFEELAANVKDIYGNKAQPLLDRIEQAKQEALAAYNHSGHMYEVNIAADPEHFLDWDKPLSEQSPYVKDTLANAWLAHPEAHAHQTGGQIYESSRLVPGDYRDPEAATNALRQAGIPGIKYRDAGSRTALEDADLQRRASDLDRQIGNAQKQMSALPESMAAEYQGHIDNLSQERSALQKKLEPTRNFVVFDQNLISIVRKYGIPGAVGLGLITPEMGRQMQEQGL